MTTSSRLFPKVLLTNDDGFDAPGLRTLTEVAEELAEEVWIVAPNYDQSGTSHSLSLHSPLRVSQKEERRYSVSGTPGDCVAMAVRHLMVSGRPDLILSGINRGANLGIETVFSGTVGAAMTGLLLGIPSMALTRPSAIAMRCVGTRLERLPLRSLGSSPKAPGAKAQS
jgi:5'-nucleotidase